MEPEDQAMVDAVQDMLDRLVNNGCGLGGEDLLNAAIAAAGYNVGMSSLEQCELCGVLYHSDYDGEYVDPFDHADLQRELRIRGMKQLYYQHFCDFDCLRAAAYAIYRQYV